MGRIILHCDLNCFYASVELLSHQDLVDVPMAVCGDPSARHGIILAKNEPAKQMGVVTAETIWQAKRKCPGLVLLPPHHDLYREYSKRVNALYNQYTDLVEPFGIDESWLDITGTAHLFGGDGVKIADELRRRIREEFGLTASVGVSFNKVFAKLGSDYKKPDATTLISPENWREIVWPLPVGSMLFVGQAVKKALGRFGITTIGQLAGCSAEMLEGLLGKQGLQLHAYANGLDQSRVLGAAEQEPVKSVGNSSTFPRNLTTWDEVRTGIAMLSDSVAMRLRRHSLCAGGVQVTVRDPEFQNRSRQTQFSHPTHLMRELSDGAMELIKTIWRPPSPIRMLSVTAIHLVAEEESYAQLDLLNSAAKSEKQEKLERAMDSIRGRYGKDAIAFGSPAGRLDETED
ncbi:DNA polymerase IV [Oscillibacter hominis]|uniref:DNA polymerase IV n=1 Tax=Oscillibacter hominis TaxID=2763056 RepID=A0A7G9B624_9FIRM|nr:DNA polymerase IV [Oscillibacter hominis]QNL45005.1 DNA polymerase IV [Oscillibacter hominis]